MAPTWAALSAAADDGNAKLGDKRLLGDAVLGDRDAFSARTNDGLFSKAGQSLGRYIFKFGGNRTAKRSQLGERRLAVVAALTLVLPLLAWSGHAAVLGSSVLWASSIVVFAIGWMLLVPFAMADGVRGLLTLAWIACFTFPVGLFASRGRQAPILATIAAIILLVIFLPGGPPHQDLYDLKPDAPAEVRGEFKPISTSVPGLAAKAVIDIQVSVASLETPERFLVPLTQLGYLHVPMGDFDLVYAATALPNE